MNPVTKAIFSNKLSSVGNSVTKSMGLDEKEDNTNDPGLSAKEVRKLHEKDEAERAKRDQMHAKRNADREKKREEMRAKYGLQKDQQDGSKKQGDKKAKGQAGKTNERRDSQNRMATKEEKEEDDGKCLVM